MAVRIKGVPPDLPNGIYRVVIRRVKNAKGFLVMEGELAEPPPVKKKVHFITEEDVFTILNGRTRLGEFPIGRLEQLRSLLERLNCEVIIEEGTVWNQSRTLSSSGG